MMLYYSLLFASIIFLVDRKDAKRFDFILLILIVIVIIKICYIYTAYVSFRWLRNDTKENREKFSSGQYVCFVVYFFDAISSLIFFWLNESSIRIMVNLWTFNILF